MNGMEYEPQYDLFWVQESFDACKICQGTLHAEDVEFCLHGPEILDYDWTLGHCAQCGQWYGIITDLLSALIEEATAPNAIDGFTLNGQPVSAGIWVNAAVGIIPWETFKAQVGQLGAPPSGPPPSPMEVRTLPLLSESWEVGVRAAAWFLNEQGEHTQGYIALVLDPAVGIRAHHLKGETPHEAPELATLLLEAASRPGAGQPGRPLEVHLNDATLAGALAAALADVDIKVRAAPTPMADEALDGLQKTLHGEEDEPFFAAYDEPSVRAFFKAAHAFYRIRPWERIDGNKYVAFRLDDGPWGYLNVMGQMGEEFGLSIFDDWLQLCALIHNQPTPWDYMMGAGEEQAIEAAGALEGLTLEPPPMLHPDDADYVRQLGIKPLRKGLYPTVRRFTLDGLEPPHLSLHAYYALMTAMTKAISQRRAATITSIKQHTTVGETTVTLRYPARGDEPFEDHPPGNVRLIVSGLDQKRRAASTVMRIEIDTPGDARVDEVIRAVRKEYDDFWITEVTSEGYAVWSDGRQPRGAPCPRVAHLAALPEMAMTIFETEYPLQVMPRMGAGGSQIQVRLIPA